MSNTEMQTVTLSTPLERGKTKITEVLIRKPKGGDLRGLSLMQVASSDYDTMVKLLPRISEPVIHKHDLDDMEVSDLMDISMGVAGFFIKGEKPSLDTSPQDIPTK